LGRYTGPVEKLSRPGWLIADHDGLSGRATRLPEREDTPVPVNEQLIVELYSR
jgi:small subunit ribosomal protein S4